jgi:RNA polymerase sigma-70 factor (ECF subfamily)
MYAMDRDSFTKEADRVLVENFIRNRDETTFREIYRRHTPVLYLLALRLLAGSEASAQDAVQETWIRACKSLLDFRWRSSLRTWLSGILINCVREMKHAPQAQHEVGLPDELAGPPEIETVTRMDLEGAIAQLPDGYRHVLILHDIEGYTHEEIGAHLGINVGTSKSQLFYARRALRNRFRLEVRW